MNKEKPQTKGIVVSVPDKRRFLGVSIKQPSFFNKKTLGLVLLVTVIILVVAFVVHRQHENAFTINGTNYSSATINSMATYAAAQSTKTKQQQAQSIFNLYKTEVAAKQAGIIPNSNELQAATKQLTFPNATTPEAKQYVQLVTFDTALPLAYARYKQGGYQGTEYVFSYAERVEASVDSISGHGDQTLIAQDQQYAQQQANAYYAAYQKDPTAAANFEAQLGSLTKIGFAGGVSSFSSDQAGDLASQIGLTDIYHYVTSQTKPGLSAVKIGKVETKFSPGPKDYADGYYYFVTLDKAGKVIADPAGTITTGVQKLQVSYHGI